MFIPVAAAMCTSVLVITTVTAPNINDPVTLFWRANLSQQISSTAWLATLVCLKLAILLLMHLPDISRKVLRNLYNLNSFWNIGY